ncbi:MAG: class I SAM-dependent methyltransferase, partial [Promethearchaeota archaeon]
KGEKKQSNLDFKCMSFFFKIRDKFNPPINKVRKTKIRTGNAVLDYACGIGSYSIAAAEIVGSSGKVFAADIHPIAIEKVNKMAHKKNLGNVQAILTDCNTGLKDGSIDVVIFFDAIHGISNMGCILEEFHRVLKPNTRLYVDDHHLNEHEIIAKITEGDMFKFTENEDGIYNFIKK